MPATTTPDYTLLFALGGRFGFLDEPALALVVGDELRRKRLESHLAIELDVHGTINDPCAAPAQLAEYLVVGERRPDHGPSVVGENGRFVRGSQKGDST
jgi:hypothetical protein